MRDWTPFELRSLLVVIRSARMLAFPRSVVALRVEAGSCRGYEVFPDKPCHNKKNYHYTVLENTQDY